MSIEAMKMALETLEYFDSEYDVKDEITALRAAIAEASGQQAIAMRVPKAGDRVICIEDDSAGTVEFTSAAGGPHIKFDDGSYGLWSLRQFGELFCYATPPRREWVGLTDEDKLSLAEAFYSTDIARVEAVEALVKEKNS